MEEFDAAFSDDKKCLVWSLPDSIGVVLSLASFSLLDAFKDACAERFSLFRLVSLFSAVFCKVNTKSPAVDGLSPYTLGREADDVTRDVFAMELPASVLSSAQKIINEYVV